MRLLRQNIAQRANREDEELGKFWQARYRAVRLPDKTAILACAAYVDLNPIRAAGPYSEGSQASGACAVGAEASVIFHVTKFHANPAF